MNYPPNCAGSYAIHCETFSSSFQGLLGLNFSSGAAYFALCELSLDSYRTVPSWYS